MYKLILLAFVFISNCTNQKLTNQEDEIMSIGDCVVFQSLIDSEYYGLILYGIDSNAEGTSYSFCISGEEFSDVPSEEKFLDAGIFGRKIASGDNIQALTDGSFQNNPDSYSVGFTIVSIQRNELSKMLKQFKKVGSINVAQNHNVNANFYNASNFSELEDACTNQIAHLNIEPADKYLAPLQTFPLAMIIAKKGQQLQTAETHWVISPKNASQVSLELFTGDFYWDTVNEFAPFGSDEGFDTVHSLKTWLKDNPKGQITDFLEFVLNGWGVNLDLQSYLLNADPT